MRDLFEVLSNCSMKPSKLKLHLQTRHSKYSQKDRTFFERHRSSLKSIKLDSDGRLHETNAKILEASYAVSLAIAKEKKPHIIGETLIKPCAKKMVEIVLGKEAEKKIAAISLSNNTVQKRIADKRKDIKEQVVEEILSAPFGLFSIQLDKSTDIESCSQLMAFVRYIHSGKLKEEFLFRTALKSTTKASDILTTMSTFFENNNLSWVNLCGVCTDGAPAMIGSRSGFQALVKHRAPAVKGVHCMIHRQALASKTLPESLSNVLQQSISLVNYIKSSALNTRLFKELCEETEAEHNVLLFNTRVRWLSKGNMTARVLRLRNEIKIFCEKHRKTDFVAWLDHAEWQLSLAYLVDIFEQLNKLNLLMQGRHTNIIKFVDALKSFLCKLRIWSKKVLDGNYSMFKSISTMLEMGNKQMPVLLQENIIFHLTALEEEFKHYFPEVSDKELNLVRNPFRCSVDSIPDEQQDELIDLQNDSTAKDLLDDNTVEEFWIRMIGSYPYVARVALCSLLPFVSTYLCKSGF